MEIIREFLNGLSTHQDISMFIMRLLVGGLFAYSGWKKLHNLKGFSRENDLPLAIGTIAVLFELIGGLGLLLGVLTQVAAIMIMLIMLGAMHKHIFKWKSPYWAQDKGWEYDLMWFVMCLVILTNGGGSIALYPLF